MNPQSLQHTHDFNTSYARSESSTRKVMWLTTVTMLIEIIAGTAFGSMALLADGWHMGTHVAAFAIAIFAYRYARTHALNPCFTYGTGKVGVLGGFASAMALLMVALVMAGESVSRLFSPQAIQFNEAIAVAIVGLLVNLISGFILHEHHHDHDHAHDDNHKPKHAHHDHNLRAAYLHLLADALTSVFAIVALLTGKVFGWLWMDPLMGIVGALVISRWAYGLLGQTSGILLDGAVDERSLSTIKHAIELDPESTVSDLHLWHLSPNHLAASVAIVTAQPREPAYYKAIIGKVLPLAHLTIEVNSINADGKFKSEKV